MAWCDVGVNLFSEQFAGDREQVVARAQDAGIQYQVLIASDLAECQQNLSWCQQHTGCSTTAGIHPHQASKAAADWLQQLQSILAANHIVAIGECGLDFNRNFSSQSDQIDVFARQLQLAQEVNLPVYLHERDAFVTQYQLLKDYGIGHGIAHCFTGDTTQLKAYLDLGLYIGITGWLCDERRNQALVEALRYLPLDRICLETDAPFLLPRNLSPKPKSRRNEPAYLAAIASQLAQLKGIALHEVEAQCWQNSVTLFNLERSG
jgi:TatD DNase family protein